MRGIDVTIFGPLPRPVQLLLLGYFLLAIGVLPARALGQDCPATKQPLVRGVIYQVPSAGGQPQPLTKVLAGRGISIGSISPPFERTMSFFYTISTDDTSKFGAILVKRLESLNGEDRSDVVSIANNIQPRNADRSWVEVDVSFDDYKSYHEIVSRLVSPFDSKLHVWFEQGDRRLRSRTDSSENQRKEFLFSTKANGYRATVIRFTGVDSKATCIPFVISFKKRTEKVTMKILEIYNDGGRPEVASELTIDFPKF
jgi:hypothetical protein